MSTIYGFNIAFPATQVTSSDANTQDDYEEQSTTPVPTATSGTFTTVSSTVKCTKVGNRVSINIAVTITTNGTAAGAVKVALPFTPAEIAGLGGAETALTGLGLAAYVNTDGNAYIRLYDATYPGADGRVLSVSGVYRV